MDAVHLTTADGVRLAARLLPGPDDLCVVLAHGFGVSTARTPVRAVARGLAPHASVLAYDARGHGRSAGVTTMGDLEVLDVDAAVAGARALGFPRVVTCGWSMGGAAVVRHAALRGETVGGHALRHPPDGVVAVSTAAQWSQRRTAPNAALRRVHRLVETRHGRAITRTVLRTRVARVGWDPVPAAPLEVVERVAPLPLLLVHGDRDAFFPVHHPQSLVTAAPATELWLEPGFGHAETAATPELLDRLGRRLRDLVPADAEERTA